MAKVLIVEDQAADVHFAADVVRSLGITDIEARSTAGSAKAYLDMTADMRCSATGTLIAALPRPE